MIGKLLGILNNKREDQFKILNEDISSLLNFSNLNLVLMQFMLNSFKYQDYSYLKLLEKKLNLLFDENIPYYILLIQKLLLELVKGTKKMFINSYSGRKWKNLDEQRTLFSITSR